MICVVKTHHGWGEFDWARGLRCSSVSSGRNLDEVAAEQRVRLEGLFASKQLVDQKFEELCEEDNILNAAIREVQEALNDLMEIAHPFKEGERR